MHARIRSLALVATLTLSACTRSVSAPAEATGATDSLKGAWRSQIHFESGAFAQLKGLEFMYAFNQGGTLTESSNYDAAPPVPPAYGIWRATGPRQFEAKYVFYVTAPPKKLEELTANGGWTPAGSGVFKERIQLSVDGQTYTSTIDYAEFDNQGKPSDAARRAQGSGKRITF